MRWFRRQYSEHNVHAAKEAIDAASAVVLDVRENDEWTAGHIPGAVHIPLGDLQSRLNQLPRDRRLLVVCRGGNRSATATRLLQESGYRAANVEGGMKSWAAAGYPLEPPEGWIA